MDEKKKAETKMFLWYIFIMPLKQIRYTLKEIEGDVSVEVINYVYLIIAIALFMKNRNDWWWLLFFIMGFIVLLWNIWRKKRFINEYRKEHY